MISLNESGPGGGMGGGKGGFGGQRPDKISGGAIRDKGDSPQMPDFEDGERPEMPDFENGKRPEMPNDRPSEM